MTTTNGQEDLASLRVHDPLPALSLLDLMMPVMDGVHFRRKQQADPELQQMPVVVFSAGVNLRRALLLTPDACWLKPFEYEEFVETVTRYTTR